MKVYVIWYDNGEPYEDNYQNIDKIFSTRELAEEYLDKYYKKVEPDQFSSWKQEPYWVNEPYICSHGISDTVECQECPKYYESDNYDGTLFEDEEGNDTNECPELIHVDMNYYSSHESYRIREFDIFESIDELESEVDDEDGGVAVKNDRYNSDGIELNSKSVNKSINYKILSDKEMESIGFRKVNDEWWYYSKKLNNDSVDGRDFSISFNVTLPIPVDNDRLDISVLDEAVLQPYDFQYVLNTNPKHKYANEIANAFEKQMAYLENKGVLSGHKNGEYV